MTLKKSVRNAVDIGMTLLYLSTLLVGLYLAVIAPAERALRERARLRFCDQMRAIQLRYSRLSFSALRDLSADEIDQRYGLSQCYRRVRPAPSNQR